MSMKLVERYLQEAKFWLPQAQRNDILAELSEDIRSQIEDREGELGRALEESEVSEILRKRGHPIELASRYLPQGHLIGPVFFPAYCFVLKLVLLWILPPVFLIIVAPIILVADATPGITLMKLAFRLPQIGFTIFGAITLVFALLERNKLPYTKWDPSKLPHVQVTGLHDESAEISRFTSVTRLLSGIIWSVAWLYVIWFQPRVDFAGVQVALSPIWRSLFWPILLVILGGVVLSWVNNAVSHLDAREVGYPARHQRVQPDPGWCPTGCPRVGRLLRVRSSGTHDTGCREGDQYRAGDCARSDGSHPTGRHGDRTAPVVPRKRCSEWPTSGSGRSSAVVNSFEPRKTERFRALCALALAVAGAIGLVAARDRIIRGGFPCPSHPPVAAISCGIPP
jgi:hypothetical protein